MSLQQLARDALDTLHRRQERAELPRSQWTEEDYEYQIWELRGKFDDRLLDAALTRWHDEALMRECARLMMELADLLVGQEDASHRPDNWE